MNFVEAMTAAQAGFDTWAAKPHNKKWAKMVYHTPIPNDLLVNIAEAFCRASAAPLPTGNEATDTDGTPLQVASDEELAEFEAALAAAPPKTDALKEAMRHAMDIYQADDVSDIVEAMFMVLYAALAAASQRSQP